MAEQQGCDIVQTRPGRDPWVEHMRAGNFEAAWKLSDAVLKTRAGRSCYDWPRHFQWVWDGTPLAGQRVLVRCYHGLGDTIQFIRYLPMLHSVARETIVWAQPKLLPLLQSMQGIDRLLPLDDGTPDADYDVDVELMELPYIFRSTLDTLPGSVPYLNPASAPNHLVDHERSFREVGIVWRAGDWDDRRSIPVEELAPLRGISGIRLRPLQHGSFASEWPEPISRLPLADCAAEAAYMRTLDLIITVDSFPAHLAGAIGIPVWTLLPFEADWRWMVDRTDSPWYPSMRLFRQPRPGQWREVIEVVAQELRRISIHHKMLQCD